MQSMRFSRACLAALLGTLLFSTIPTFAKNGRDFIGFYNVSHATRQGNDIHITLNLKFQNLSSSTVRQAVVTLRQHTGMELVGRTAPIKLLRNHDSAKVSQRFTVSRTEYETWRQGSQPTVFITYRDAHGTQLERYIQLAPSHTF
jgi:hypothetical protein